MAVLLSNKHLCFLHCILAFLSGIFTYNLDTEFPVLFKRESSQDDYFGFSVGLLRTTDGGYKALITAPRANSTSNKVQLKKLHQPGALFSCDISDSDNTYNTSSCEEVVVDKSGNQRIRNEKMDDMWLGVSLDVQGSTDNSNVVVCGHLRKIDDQNYYFPQGVCYVINNTPDSKSVEKLTNDYTYAQLGASATFSMDGQHLLLGIPGYNIWTGTIVSYNSDSSHSIRGTKDWKDPKTIKMQMYDSKSKPDARYIGYSVTSGQFFGENTIYAAVGAPRDARYRGMVYIINMADPKVQTYVMGEQFAGYFGASVNGIDLNGDGLTDLIVGAPFYSEESGGDEGKVYVYLGKEQVPSENNPWTPSHMLSGKKTDARFGSCIGNPGDLNQDGINDVAIGAPYEDEKGAVYIYHGTREGLNDEPVQRIAAANLPGTEISGFGISISRGLDIDNNSYPDLLIGSYASSNAVLLRTRPVIHLSSELEFKPSTISKNETLCECGEEKEIPCFNVTYSLKYSGQHVLPSLVFKTVLTMDTHGQSRGFLRCDGKKQSSVSQQVVLHNGADCSFQQTAYIHKNIRDEITPIYFSLGYDLDRDNMSVCRNDSFSKDCPIIDPRTSTNITKPIYFLNDCVSDVICNANLVVEPSASEYRENPVIIGEKDTLTVKVVVSNLGEPAYGAELFILLPSQTPLVKQNKMCKSSSEAEEQYANTTLQCDLGVLKKDKNVELDITIDVKNLPVSTTTLNIYFLATSLSEESDRSDNELKIPITFEAAADITIAGNPETDQIPCTGQKSTATIYHKYYVTYYGPSPVSEIIIYLYVPSAVQGKRFLDAVAAPIEGEIATTCNVSSEVPWRSQRNYMKPEVNDDFSENNQTDSAEDSSDHLHRIQKRSTGENTAPSTAKRGEDYILDCKEADCEVIRCTTGPVLSGQKSTKITLSAQVNITVLSSVLGTWSTIKFVTKGLFSVQGIRMLSAKSRMETTMATVILRPGPSAAPKVDNWIIFVSAGVGLLLLLIILFALIKFGFFKRQQREKMRAMMCEAKLNELHPPENVNPVEIPDDKKLCKNSENDGTN